MMVKGIEVTVIGYSSDDFYRIQVGIVWRCAVC